MKSGAHTALRLRYAKRGRIRFISHRDVARAFERALRAAGLPLAFTQGFTPRPRMGFGPALALGYESDAEYLDVALERPVELERLPVDLSAVLPTGLTVTGVAELAARAPALGESITHHCWEIEVTPAIDAFGEPAPGPAPARLLDVVGGRVDALRSRSAWEVERDRKGITTRVEVRAGLHRVEVVPGPDGAVLLTVEVGAGATSPRPAEVVAAVAADLGLRRVIRRAQWIERDGVRRDPLVADAARTPLECAS